MVSIGNTKTDVQTKTLVMAVVDINICVKSAKIIMSKKRVKSKPGDLGKNQS